MSKLIPCREPLPSMPKGPKPLKDTRIFQPDEFFGFDTETTTCGLKELRSYQASWIEKGTHRACILALKGWYGTTIDRERLHRECENLVIKQYVSVRMLRIAVQRMHEKLIFGNQPRLIKSKFGNWRQSGRKAIRCAVAFNGNFDLGAMADSCYFSDELSIGGMSGAGVRYLFTSGERRSKDGCSVYGLSLRSLYLGADNVPFLPKRGLLWDIQPPAKWVWGCMSLAAVGEHIGEPKLDPDFNDPLYALKDAVITRLAAVELSKDIQAQGFKGFPDRFISAATISKDLMRRNYRPFLLDEEQHKWIWPAYFGGMTGAVRPEVIVDREPLSNVVYGDLDGAYSSCAQLMEVFNWDSVTWLEKTHVDEILSDVRKNPHHFWKYASLHIDVRGNFDRIPVRVAEIGDTSEDGPSQSQGLVWAKMRNYRTVLSLGDFLHCQPKGTPRIYRGLIANKKTERGADLFKMCADKRAEYPKKKFPIENRWWKTCGNSLYGCFAQRNGKQRLDAGIWFNAIIASSITAGIRHCIWTINEGIGNAAYYNDTDSVLMDESRFEDARSALAPLRIGFDNKTDDELGKWDVAETAIIQGSKRYAMLAPDGTFGAKCHGLGSWFVADPDNPRKTKSIAHDPALLRTIWALNYPEIFGEPNRSLAESPVFHRFSVRTQRVSDLVVRYASRKYGGEDFTSYGRAGNFGFISPTKPHPKKPVLPEVSYEPSEAANLSALTLEEVAYGWGSSVDKKYDYEKESRWEWKGNEVREVGAVARTQDIGEGGGAITDISIGVKHA